MSKQKLRSLGRRALIVLLIAGAVILLRETGYYAGLREKLTRGSEYQEAVPNAANTVPVHPLGAVQPLAAVVNLGGGEHCGAAYDAERVTEIFRRFSADFGEALGSAGAPEPITEEQFRVCLNSSGVYLRFYCPQPLELLSVWLGAEIGGNAVLHSAELLCLCVDGSEALLCYRTEEKEYYSCTTAVSAERLRSRTAEFSGDGVQFAFENELLQGGDGCAVLCGGSRSVSDVRCTVPQPGKTETDTLLRSVGMNSYVTGSYAEADGTVVYIDEEGTLRLSPAGSLNYRCPEYPGSAETQTLTEAVALAWQTAETCAGAGCGDGTLLFAGASFVGAQNSWTVCFDYAVGGIPVRLASGPAVEIVLRGGRLIQARMQLNRFSLSEERTMLLPDLQALAIAAAADSAAELCYSAGGEIMNCDWVKTDG